MTPQPQPANPTCAPADVGLVKISDPTPAESPCPAPARTYPAPVRKLIGGIGALTMLAGLGVGTAPTASGIAEPLAVSQRTAELDTPNVVLITSDDQSLMEIRWMPKTRRLLGKTGVTFRNMIAPHPNCCPSRAQILTGQYAHNNGVATNSPPNGGHAALKSDTALPVWLHRAGYQTGFVGKYLHGYDEDNAVEPGWDRFRPIITKPLSNYFGLVQSDHGLIRRYPDRVHHTELVARQSRGMVSQFARNGAPFFLWSSYIAPHGTCATSEEKNCSGPPLPSAKYRGTRPGVRLPSLDAPSFNEADLSDKPGLLRKKRVSAKSQQRLFTARLRAIASLDDAVASTVRALKRAGVLDKTLIMFTSDNGYMFGEHRRTGKVLAYEESIRVPLLMSGPGVPAGKTRNQTVAMIDLAPTIARVARAKPLVPVDGVNITPYASRNAKQRDRALLVQAGGTGQPGNWYFRAVRTDRYTFVDWPNPAKDEMYDRRRDPWQMDSVAKSRSYARTRLELAAVLRQLETCSGRACRVQFTESGR